VSLKDFQDFFESKQEIMHRWIAEGHFALAGHLLEIQVKYQHNVSPVEESPSFVWFIEQEHLGTLCAELAAACRAALERGTLLESIADLACLRAVLRSSGDAWDDDCRQKFDELLDRPTQLDRFTWYCYGEEEPGNLYVGRLVGDRGLFRARLIDRLKRMMFAGSATEQLTGTEASAVSHGGGPNT
jgi:hypothetical protein